MTTFQEDTLLKQLSDSSEATQLDLSNLRILNATTEGLSEIFSSIRHYNLASTIFTLDLSQNNLQNLPEDIFQGLENLHSLNLSENNFDNKNTIHLSEYLEESNIISIDLSDNNLSATGAVALLMHTKIESLDLSGNSIGDKGLIGISYVLRNNKALRILKLNHTDIAYTGISALADTLKNQNTLESLELGDNQDIGSDGIAMLCDALAVNTSLSSLNLFATELTDNEAFMLGKIFHQNSALTSLNLSSNQISYNGTTALLEGLSNNRHLTTLTLTNNHLSKKSPLFIEIDKMLTLNKLCIEKKNEQLLTRYYRQLQSSTLRERNCEALILQMAHIKTKKKS